MIDYSRRHLFEEAEAKELGFRLEDLLAKESVMEQVRLQGVNLEPGQVVVRVMAWVMVWVVELVT